MHGLTRQEPFEATLTDFSQRKSRMEIVSELAGSDNCLPYSRQSFCGRSIPSMDDCVDLVEMRAPAFSETNRANLLNVANSVK
jgi:hypothetical protein